MLFGPAKPAESITGCPDTAVFGVNSENAWARLGGIPADFIYSADVNSAGQAAFVVECDAERRLVTAEFSGTELIAGHLHNVEAIDSVNWVSDSLLHIGQLGTDQLLDIDTGEISAAPASMQGVRPFAYSHTAQYIMAEEEWSCDGSSLPTLVVYNESSKPATDVLAFTRTDDPALPSVALFAGLREAAIENPSTIAWMTRCEPFSHIFSATIAEDGTLPRVFEHRVSNESRVIDGHTRIGPDGFVLAPDGQLHIWTFQPEANLLQVNSVEP